MASQGVQHGATRSNVMHRQQEDRRKRTFNILQSYDPIIANEVCYRHKDKNSREYHVIFIQKMVRGFLARKYYTELLYEQYIEEEQREREIQNRRVQEGLAELESKRIEGDIKNRRYLQRQKDLQKEYAATLIQRSYRRYLEKKGFAKLNRDASYYQGYTPRYFQTEESTNYSESSHSSTSINAQAMYGKKGQSVDSKDQDEEEIFDMSDHKFFITNDYIGNFNKPEYEFEDKVEAHYGPTGMGATGGSDNIRLAATGETNLSDTFGSSIHSIRGFKGFLNETTAGAADEEYQKTFERVHYYKDLNLISPHSADASKVHHNGDIRF